MLDNRSTGNSEPSTTPSSASDTEVAALAHRVATARGKLPLQSDPALFAELSEAEITAERELAEWMRKQRRQQRRRSVTAELAAEKRDRRVALALHRADDADTRWHRRALAARRRVSNPDARLAQLYRRAEWSSRALIGVVVLGMLWAGVNVQHNLVPSGDMTDPLYWLSYGFEAMISIPIITIMVVATTAARWGREIARGKVVFLETALLGVTIALNAGPHLAAGALARAAEAAVAPVMVGVVIWLHAWVSARYAQLIEAIPAEVSAHPDNTTAPDDRTRDYPATTVEFGEPCPTFTEFAPDTTESAALPMGRTSGPAADPFRVNAGLFDTVGAQSDAPPRATPAAEPTAPHTTISDKQQSTSIGEHSIAHDPNGIDLRTAQRHPDAVTASPQAFADRDTEPAHKITEQAQEISSEPQSHNIIDAAPSVDPTGVSISEPAHDTTGARTQDSSATDAGTPLDSTPAGKPEVHNNIQLPSRPTATAAHPYDRRPTAASEPATPAPATPAERGTQLALDETAAPEPPARHRPRLAPTPSHPVYERISRDFADAADDHAPDTSDDTDDIPAEFDDAEVWAVAREISERRLSKLPVEQLAEVLTLAEESWTPAAIGASIGLPGSRILGILEAARRLRPYAISG